LEAFYVLVAAVVVGLILNHFHMPGGMMIGAVLGASTASILLGGIQMPSFFKVAAQIVAGAFIGTGINRQELRKIRYVFKPALIVIFGLLTLNILTGFLIHRLYAMDLLTAFLGTTPGGISEVPIVAADLGADTSKVLALQLVRYIIGIGFFPLIIGKFTSQTAQDPNEPAASGSREKQHLLPVVLTLLVALFAGMIGKITGMPAGTMAFATIGSAVFKLTYVKAALPRSVRKAAQCMSGAFVGAGIGVTQLFELRLLLAPALILIFSLLLGTFFIGMVLHGLKFFSIREAMLAATPAGASDMALISADLGIKNINLVMLQVMRMISVISFFPSLLHLITGWF
jgi:membrane AbrB-like protein